MSKINIINNTMCLLVNKFYPETMKDDPDNWTYYLAYETYPYICKLCNKELIDLPNRDHFIDHALIHIKEHNFLNFI